MTELSNDYLLAAFNGKIMPCETMVKFYYHLRMHADGEYAKALIEERRPSESLNVKEYREKIFIPITEGAFGKIITSLSKIRKSPDWNIKYNNDNVPKRIIEQERPQEYFEKGFGAHKSITNWTFSVLLKNYLIDSGALVFTMPTNLGSDEGVYLKPVPTIFNSDHVIDFVAGNYAVLLSEEKSTYKASNKTYTDGKIIYIVTETYIQKWNQTGTRNEMTEQYTWNHGLGFLPVTEVKGTFFKTEDKRIVYKSKIYPIVHRFDEAVREYSDLQAEVVQHIHSEKWVYATQQCNTCNGLGKMKDGKMSNCTNPNCNGGKVVNGPYETLVVTPTSNLEGGGAVPTPPAGYIQKQVEIVTIQDKRVQDHIYYGLSAINMEFLSETPLNQSGAAKEVDKDELNNFVNSVAEDLVSIMDDVAICVMKYRYGNLITNDTELMAISPIIAVPERFDLLNTNYILTEIKNAKDSGVSSFTFNELQLDYANKKFSHDKDVAKKLSAIITLDPLAGYTQDEKLSMLQNNGISDIDYVTSSNIGLFINMAIIEDDKFLYTPVKQQMDVINKMAIKKIAEITPATSLMSEIDLSNGGGGLTH